MVKHPVILFDGVCNFCNSTINFILKQDKNAVFRFLPLQSEKAKELLSTYAIKWDDPESFILLEDGKIYQKSEAALRVLNKLPWYWKEIQVLRIVPAFLRNAIYDFIARNRYKWFGKKDTCMIPTKEMSSRFLNG